MATLEIKSGYGLDRETELRMLRVAREIGRVRPVRVRTSFLGAHAVPDGLDADDYIDRVCIPTLRAAAAEGLVDAVDAFCEGIAFAPPRWRRVFAVAREPRPAGEDPRRAALEPRRRAARGRVRGAARPIISSISTTRACAAMAAAGTVAVILPGAFYTLRETQAPPVALLRAARRADGGGDRLQPRLLADGLDPPRDEHGLHPVPPDAGGGAGRRHAGGGPRARARRLRA